MELAHSENNEGICETLVEHLSTVANRCRQLGKPLGFEEEAYICGLLHDLGKLGTPFQERLQGKRRRVNHWSFGSKMALHSLQGNGAASAIAINGHHTGLDAIKDSCLIRLWNMDALTESLKKNGQTLSQVELETAINWLKSVGFDLPKFDESILPYPQVQGSKHPAGEMANLRMLYSVLVDSDFLETTQVGQCLGSRGK
jgi:CRISPR-associated endonuclease/helicase Cas3